MKYIKNRSKSPHFTVLFWSFQPESIAEFSWCLGGQIDVENPNKLTPLIGASLFGQKKKKKNMWSAIVPCYLVLFIFVYVSREMWSDREIKPKRFQWRLWLMFHIILLCSLVRKCVRAGRRRALYKWLVNFGVCTTHKNCACAVHVPNKL